MGPRREDHLFNTNRISDLLQNYKEKMIAQIDALNRNEILNTNPDDLASHLESKYSLDAPVLLEEHIHMSDDDIKIELSNNYELYGQYGSGKLLVDGTRFTFHIPFSGNSDIFKSQPTTYSMNLPVGKIVGTELQVIYEERNPDTLRLKQQFNSDLANIKKYLNQLSADVASHNASLKTIALDNINKRREKLINDQKIVADLGFPVKLRPGAADTFAYPTKRVQIPMPQPSKVPGQPLDPALDMAIYESILKILQDMSVAIERAPSAFRNIDEESLRHHFLVSLNGHFESDASGETFNCDGKTDILIQVNGKNIFIAECKFWDGPKSLSDAIDQVLGYATWRDTKIAILVFSRAKDFTKVVARLGEVVKAHDNFIRELTFPSETGYRAIVKHKNDSDRELTLTVLAFDIPS